MKIVHIIFSLQVGGAESMLIDIMHEQIKLGHNVQLIIVNNEINTDLEASISKDVDIIKLHRTEGSKNPLFMLKLYFHLYKLQSNIVHCHNVFMGKILKYYRQPKIITIHTTGTYTHYLTNFDHIVSISKAVQNDLLKQGDCESSIIHNGVNTKNILVRANYYISDKFRIIQVGRLEHKIKGQDLAIKALHILRNKQHLKNVTLTFIGTGSSEKYLKELSVELNIAEYVTFLGLKNKDYIYQHLKDYNLLMQPSRYEGFGLTIIEGMAAKLPVVVSNIEGPMEVIQSGKIGNSFDCNDSDDLVKVLFSVIENAELEKIENAYAYTLEHYTIESTVKQYIDLYNEMIKDPK